MSLETVVFTKSLSTTETTLWLIVSSLSRSLSLLNLSHQSDPLWLILWLRHRDTVSQT